MNDVDRRRAGPALSARGRRWSSTTARRAGSADRAARGPDPVGTRDSHRRRRSCSATAASIPVAGWRRRSRRWPGWTDLAGAPGLPGLRSERRPLPGAGRAGGARPAGSTSSTPSTRRRSLDWVAGADVDVMVIQPTELNDVLSHAEQAVREPRGRGAGRLERLPVAPTDRHRRPGRAARRGLRSRPTRTPSPTRSEGILELDPVARADLRARCLRAAHERWNWETESARLVDLYAEPGAGPARRRGAPTLDDGTDSSASDGRAPAVAEAEPLRPGPWLVGSAGRQRLVLVLPSTGEFDSRTYRIASAAVRRGHEVTVLAQAARRASPATSSIPTGTGSSVSRSRPCDGLPLPAAHPPGDRPSAQRRRARPRRLEPTSADGRRRLPAGLRAAAGVGRRAVRRAWASAVRIAAIVLIVRSQTRAARAVDPGGDVYHAMAYMGIPVGSRPRPAVRRSGGLRRPRHLRRRQQPRPTAVAGPTPARPARARLGAPGRCRRHGEPTLRRGDGRPAGTCRCRSSS